MNAITAHKTPETTPNTPLPSKTEGVTIGNLQPVNPNPPTTKSAPTRYEECADLIRAALAEPSKQTEVLQQLASFFETRIRGVRTARTKDGADAVKHRMEGKWQKSDTRVDAPSQSGLIGGK